MLLPTVVDKYIKEVADPTQADHQRASLNATIVQTPANRVPVGQADVCTIAYSSRSSSPTWHSIAANPDVSKAFTNRFVVGHLLEPKPVMDSGISKKENHKQN